MTHLAWVPPEMLDIIGPAPAGVELAPIPGDPASDPRAGDVEMFVVPLASPSSNSPAALAGLWRAMPGLRHLQVLSAGVDWVVGTVPEGVALYSGRGVHDVPVAEWVVAAILAGLKRFGQYRDDMHEGAWRPVPVEDISGANVLFVGYGSIGRAVEARLTAFGPRTVARVARHAREGVHAIAELPNLLPDADVVIVLVPLTPETRGMVDDAFLARMKSGALLVNAARGKVVDTDALLDALTSERLRAVIDVTDPEPLPSGHPLWAAPGLLITPHIAGITPDLLERAAALVRDQLVRLGRDEELANQVRQGY
jgi:phosphoglycerate dehydrogenase-like enzyme